MTQITAPPLCNPHDSLDKLSLEEWIERCVKAKVGDNEFSLHYYPQCHLAWVAQIGNPVQSVNLGESVGEFCEHGQTVDEAMSKLFASITNGPRIG